MRATLTCNSPYIEILNNTVDYGHILPNEIYSPTKCFSFKVSETAPSIARNDLNGVRFHLTISRHGSSVHSIDTFSVDVYHPIYKITNQTIVSTSDGDLIPESEEEVLMKIKYKQIGKGRSNVILKVKPYKHDKTIMSCEVLSDTLWKFKLKSDYDTKKAIRVRMELYNNGLLEDSIPLASINSKTANDIENFILKPQKNSIQFVYTSNRINRRALNYISFRNKKWNL